LDLRHIADLKHPIKKKEVRTEDSIKVESPDFWGYRPLQGRPVTEFGGGSLENQCSESLSQKGRRRDYYAKKGRGRKKKETAIGGKKNNSRNVMW